jgi:hypothetical protein
MNEVVRAFKKSPACFLVLLFGLLLCCSVADAARNFPQNAQRGTITEHQYPLYKIGYATYRIAAGGRIIDQHNRIIMPASFYGKAEVMYRLDGRGELSVIWLLTPEEVALHPNPHTIVLPENPSGR